MSSQYCTAAKQGTALFITLLISGCGSIIPYKGPPHFKPANYESTGYSQSGNTSIFKTEDLTISITPVNAGDGDTGLPIINDLLDREFAVFRMVIENRSRVDIVYDPVYTALRTNSADYKKPLDYTDLFDIVGKDGEWTATQKKLRGLKGKFYDLHTKVVPGGKASKLLIFRPIDNKSTRAAIVITAIRFGTDTLKVDFIFSVSGDKEDAEEGDASK